MNRVKYVPADKTARSLSPSAVLIMEIAQGKNVYRRALFSKGATLLRAPNMREADIMAQRRGWVRLSSLSPAERRAWIQAHRKGQNGKAQGLSVEPT